MRTEPLGVFRRGAWRGMRSEARLPIGAGYRETENETRMRFARRCGCGAMPALGAVRRLFALPRRPYPATMGTLDRIARQQRLAVILAALNLALSAAMVVRAWCW
jgi:hypothetical protein